MVLNFLNSNFEIPFEYNLVVVRDEVMLVNDNMLKIKDLCVERTLAPIAVLPISAKKGENIDDLCNILVQSQGNLTSSASAGGTLVTNIRHYQALMDAQIALDRVEDGLASGIPTDLVAQDIREALYHLGSIVGEINTEEILGNIFGRFCIGK